MKRLLWLILLVAFPAFGQQTQLVSDAFTTYGPSYPANLCPTTNWSQAPNTADPLEVSSSGVVASSGGSDAGNGCIWTGTVTQSGDSWPADQYSEATLGTVSTAAFFDIYVRSSASVKTRYLLELNSLSTTQNLYTQIAGSITETYTFTATVATTNVWRLSITGSTLAVTQNGTSRLSQADTNIASGVPGFGLEETTIVTNGTYTKWAGGAVQAATPTSSPAVGTYVGTRTVVVTSSTSGGTIYYTTNGTTPTHSSSSISNGGTISVGATQTLKAFESATDFADSATGSAAFTINNYVPPMVNR